MDNLKNKFMSQLICFAVVFFCCANFQKGVWVGALNVVSYLSSFGYLPPEYKNPETANLITDESLKLALEDFQTFYGLNVSGVADAETLKLMNTPRCGVPDKVWQNSKSENYYIMSEKWDHTSLTYKIGKYSPSRQLSIKYTDTTARKMFDMWSTYSALTFTRVSASEKADLVIEFVKWEHGDYTAFDGSGGVVAHAYPPGSTVGGYIHFDESEYWSGRSGNDKFEKVALHEFGHALGLAHSSVRASVMYAIYHTVSWYLHPDDIAAIQALYGPRGGSGPKVTIRPASGSGICNLNMTDYAMLTDSDGSTYFFQGTFYWKLSENGILWEYPKKVIDTWPGLDGYIEAAFVYYGITYFFQGHAVYAFKGNKPKRSYPRLISTEFPGLPNFVKSTVVFNNKIYAFKDSKYYGYPVSFWSRIFGRSYPKPVKSKWGQEFPLDPDAVIVYKNKYIYLFKGNEYWRYDSKKRNIDKSGPFQYPRSFKQYWLHC